MSIAEWMLHYSKEEPDAAANLNTYAAVMDNFQYGAVIKHKGQVSFFANDYGCGYS